MLMTEWNMDEALQVRFEEGIVPAILRWIGPDPCFYSP